MKKDMKKDLKNFPFNYEAIEQAILDHGFTYDGWLIEIFDIHGYDDYECAKEAVLMAFYETLQHLQ